MFSMYKTSYANSSYNRVGFESHRPSAHLPFAYIRNSQRMPFNVKTNYTYSPFNGLNQGSCLNKTIPSVGVVVSDRMCGSTRRIRIRAHDNNAGSFISNYHSNISNQYNPYTPSATYHVQQLPTKYLKGQSENSEYKQKKESDRIKVSSPMYDYFLATKTVNKNAQKHSESNSISPIAQNVNSTEKECQIDPLSSQTAIQLPPESETTTLGSTSATTVTDQKTLLSKLFAHNLKEYKGDLSTDLMRDTYDISIDGRTIFSPELKGIIKIIEVDNKNTTMQKLKGSLNNNAFEALSKIACQNLITFILNVHKAKEETTDSKIDFSKLDFPDLSLLEIWGQTLHREWKIEVNERTKTANVKLKMHNTLPKSDEDYEKLLIIMEQFSNGSQEEIESMDKKCEIELEIEIDSNGEFNVKEPNIKLTDNYLSQYKKSEAASATQPQEQGFLSSLKSKFTMKK